jgi:hypothetical protein
MISGSQRLWSRMVALGSCPTMTNCDELPRESMTVSLRA